MTSHRTPDPRTAHRPGPARRHALVGALTVAAWLTGASLPACSTDKPALSGDTLGPLAVQRQTLDLAWSPAPWDDPRAPRADALSISARLDLPPNRMRPDATLVLEGLHGVATVRVNGVALPPVISSIAPARVALGEALKPGDNLLQVDVVGPPPDTEALLLGARPGRPWLAAPPWLELDAGVIEGVVVALEGDAVRATVTAPGAAAARVLLTLDGAVVQDLGRAAVTDGRAALTPTPWRGPRWGAGTEADLFQAWVVAEDAAGRVVAAGAWRTGLRTVALEGGHITRDGQPLLPAVLRHSDNGPLDETLALVRGAGLSGIELHGPPFVDAWLDRADELGLLVVATPRCDGKVQATVSRLGALAEPLARQDQALLQAAARHPSLILWSAEGSPEVIRASAAPYAADPVPRLTAGADLASEPIFLHGDAPAVDGPWWCNEVNQGVTLEALPPDSGPRAVARALAAGAVGAVVPTWAAGPSGDMRPWLSAWQLAATEIAPTVPPDGRRAPARVQVSGLAPGAVAWLEGPLRPTTGSAAGADGVAHLEAWDAGPATLRVGDQQQPVVLAPGTWQDGRWTGTVGAVAWPGGGG